MAVPAVEKNHQPGRPVDWWQPGRLPHYPPRAERGGANGPARILVPFVAPLCAARRLAARAVPPLSLMTPPDSIIRLEGFGKCNPPFRTADEVARMWDAFAAGKELWWEVV